MIRKIICALARVLLAASTAGASDIRRVVTGLDAGNKAVVMFDSRMPLQPGPYGLQATNLWVTNSYPLGFSFKNDTSLSAYLRSITAPNFAWWSFRHWMPPPKRKWSPAF